MRGREMPKKVMIVDDEEDIRISVGQILEVSGYEVIKAEDGDDCLKKLESEIPDLVVMDIKLPGMDGLEALKAMRQIDARVPVIMMTAFGTVNTAITAMKFGAYEYLLKPFDIN